MASASCKICRIQPLPTVCLVARATSLVVVVGIGMRLANIASANKVTHIRVHVRPVHHFPGSSFAFLNAKMSFVHK